MRRNGSILVPVEFSEASKTALRYAVQLAGTYGARLVLLHVVDSPPVVWSIGSVFPKAGGPSSLDATSETAFDAWLADVEFGDIEHERSVAKGPTGNAIVRAARELSADAIVLATHGATGLQARFMGGVAYQVLRDARCPVVSVKPHGLASRLGRMWEGMQLFGGPADVARRPSSTFPPRIILHPTDFSETSRSATSLAARMAGAVNASLVLLHVAPSSEPDEATAEALDQVRLQAMAQSPGLEPVLATRHGGASTEILRHCAASATDLIVMGSEGIGGPSVLSVGSTAGRVLRQAACPVVTLRADTTLRTIDEEFRKVYASLSVATLRTPDDESGEDGDEVLARELFGERGADLFLGFYTQKGFVLALEEYGIYNALRAKGFDGLRTTFDLTDPFEHSFQVYFDDAEDREHLLIEAILRPGSIELPRSDPADSCHDTLSVLIVRWLCLQNPRAEYSQRRPPMPEQAYPGLGMGRELLEILVLVAERLGKTGLVNRPMQLHNASYYHPMFRFLDPAVEGRFTALLRDTADVTLADASWAMHLGCVLDCNEEKPVSWEGHEQVYPMSPALQEYFEGAGYRTAVSNTARNERFAIDWEKYRKRISVAPGEDS